ncbi:MAG: beta-galactosidase [Kiritimatiellae bacterium]|nr:beta-galactosidase [Kiritimatiellia bacterium]
MKHWIFKTLICIWAGHVAWSETPRPELSVTLGERNENKGLSVPSAGDGQNIAELVGDHAARRVAEGSNYLYVRIDHPAYQEGPVDLYVSAEVYDDLLTRINLTFDQACSQPNLATKYTPAAAMYHLVGQKRWRTLHFCLPAVRLGHGQNSSADFRFAARDTAFRSIRVSTERPANYSEETDIDSAAFRNIAVSRTPGMEFTFGNDADPTEATLFKALSATSVESYVDWAGVEPEKDQWDWSHWDKQVAILQKAELKWVPFLIAGLAYATPLWFQNSPDSAVFKCLEHDEASKVQSLFNPALPAQVQRFIQAFAGRYRDSGVIESLLLGVTGIYGESIYPAGPQGGWTARLTGEYHNHLGWWAGDHYATQAFRKTMKSHYKRINQLNAAWETTYNSFDQVVTFLPDNAPNDRARVDLCEWYQQAMTDWSLFWVKSVRQAFPKTPIYLCTGGAGTPVLGADFTAQAAAIARYNAGIRITNEGSDYARNFVYTREVATATRHYKSFCGFEPASKVDANGIVARIYNATASGARQLHDYSGNIQGKGLASLQNLRDNVLWLVPRKPVVQAAVYLSRESWALDHEAHANIYALSRKLRDAGDFDLVTRRSLADGHLRNYTTLLLASSPVLEPESAKAIEKWVRRGGHLIVATLPGETLGDRLYDHKAWLERLFSTAQPGAPLLQPELTGEAPERWSVSIGSKEDEEWISGDWSHCESGGEWPEVKSATMRWSGARPRVLLPVQPETAYTLRLSVSVPPMALGNEGVAVAVNSQIIGRITKPGRQVAVFAVPPTIIGAQSVAQLELQTKTWKPSAANPASRDTRDLGVAVREIEIFRTGAEKKVSRSATFTYTLVRAELQRLQRKVGNGMTTILPGHAENERLIAALLQETYDGEFDRCYATRTADGILWYDAKKARIWLEAR